MLKFSYRLTLHLSQAKEKANTNMKRKKEPVSSGKGAFLRYFIKKMKTKELHPHTVYVRADIPVAYGDRLLSGKISTGQRDVILRLCYAGELSLTETQKALSLYGMQQLIEEDPRDRMIMHSFIERPGNIIDVNIILRQHQCFPLRTTGMQS